MLVRVVKKNQISDFIRSTDSLIKYGKSTMDKMSSFEKVAHNCIDNPSYVSKAIRLTNIHVNTNDMSMVFTDGDFEIIIDMP